MIYVKECSASKSFIQGLFLYMVLYVGFHGGSTVKNLPARQETQVRSLSQKDPLEEEMENQPSILAWEFPWNRAACRVTVHRVTKSQT